MRNYQKELDNIIETNRKAGVVPTLLLHACCAPCSSYCLEYLSQFFRITVFFYNPNIYPEKEYTYRAGEIRRLIRESEYVNEVSLIEGEFSPDEFYSAVKGLEGVKEGGERCFNCYELRLRKTAELCKNLGFDYFTTTLTISPLKNAEKINEIGERLAEEYGVKHLPSDFKKKNGYKRSIELSKEHNLYRQNYCGCVFSKRQPSFPFAVFDLDGTLLDTLADLHAAVNHALRQFGFPERSISEVRRFIGNGVVKLMERSTPDGTDESTNTECLGAFREYYLAHMADTTAPYEGIVDLLKKLRKNGVKIAVVSNKLHPAVVDLCEDYFSGLIDIALGVAEETERKPAPVNVYKAMELMGADKSNTIYIGDSEVDIQTANNAGLPCIGVTWGFRDRDELVSEGAKFIAADTDEVERIIL